MMKTMFARSYLILFVLYALNLDAINAQGFIEYRNFGALTRVGSLNGPLAGTNIWGQLLAGTSPDSLQRLGNPVPHLRGSLEPNIPRAENWPVPKTKIFEAIPGVPANETAYVQLVAWDGALGIRLEDIPSEWLGKTEIAPLILFQFPLPNAPHFEQPAIVQLVPEPSALALAAIGAAALLTRRRPRPSPPLGLGRG